MKELWEIVLQNLRDNLGEEVVKSWFSSVKFVGIENGVVILKVPNLFFKEWIEENYKTVLSDSLKEVVELYRDLKIEVEEKKRVSFEKKEVEFFELAKRFNLNPNYTFENFVVGPSNQFAHGACVAVAKHPAKNYNPLFIYGGVGLGKTHLLNAIGNCILKEKGNMRICYITSEEFMNQLINSIRFDNMDKFREKFRNVEILLIDDIQFIAGKERTQEEFFHTFNTLYESRKQVVVTSDKFPKDIPELEERLRSRFEWGLIADIQPPELETKVAILKKKSALNNIELPDDVAIYMASSIKSNIRELEGLLVRLSAYASLTKSKISLELAKEVLKELIRTKKKIGVEEIQKTVADHFKIKVSDMKSGKKFKNIALPRQIAMYITRKKTSLSYPEIGLRFGGKDHSTVVHAVKKIEKLLKSDEEMKKTVELIIRKLEG